MGAAEVLLASLSRLKYPVYSTVHDEITLVVPELEVQQAKQDLENAMVEGFLEIFPDGEKLLKGLVEVHTGPNWAEVH